MNQLRLCEHVDAVDDVGQFVFFERREARIVEGGGDGVVEDFFGDVLLRGLEGADAASELAVLLERYEDARTRLHFLGQIVGNCGVLSRHDEFLHALSREFHIGVFRRLDVVEGAPLGNLIAHTEVALQILALDDEGEKPVADAKRPLVRKLLDLQRLAVERSRHDPEGAQAALRRLLGECGIHLQKLQECALFEVLHARLVEARPFGGEAVRPVGRELVREVAARDEDGLSVKLLGGASDAHAEAVVIERRQP